MPITEDIRKTLTDPTPLFFAAGTVDLAAQKLRGVPEQLRSVPEQLRGVPDQLRGVPEQLRGVPELLEKLRAEAPERIATARKDVTISKVREQAQTLALQGVGVAAEYAVKARETYTELADRGRVKVVTWRGGAAPEVPAEVEEKPVAPVAVGEPEPAPGKPAAPATVGTPAKKATARKTTAKKAAPKPE